MSNYIYEYERKKIKEYINAGLYEVLKENDVYLAGGAVLSIFSNTEVQDFDLYFHSKRSLLNVFLNLDGGHILSYTNRSMLVMLDDVKYNLIYFDFFNTPQDVFDSFDFTVAMGGYSFSSEKFVFDERFHRDIIGRKLIYSATNKYPIGTLLRIKKYEEKGFHISRREMIKVALKTSFLDIDTIQKLEDHINGMYGIALEEKWEEGGFGEVTPENIILFIESLDPPVSILEEGQYIATINFDDVNFTEDVSRILKMSIHEAVKDGYVIVEKMMLDNIEELTIVDYGNDYYALFLNDEEWFWEKTKTLHSEIEDWELPTSIKLTEKVEDSFTVYKRVKKDKEGVYRSTYDLSFIYEIGKEVIPSNPDDPNSGIYASHRITELSESLGNTTLKLKVSIDDIKTDGWNGIRYKKAFVEREI